MKKSLLPRLVLTINYLICAALPVLAGDDVAALIAELERHGIEVTEKRGEGEDVGFSVSVWPVKTNQHEAANALRDFAKRNKVTRFCSGVDSALSSNFFKSLGQLADVKSLVLYRLAEGSDFAQIPASFPNAETISLIDIGILGKNAPVFPKATSLLVTSSSFDDEGLMQLTRMPNVIGSFSAAPTVTDGGLERMAAAMEPEAKARKFLDFSYIKDDARRQILERKAQELGLRD